MESEEKSMETIKASVVAIGEKYSIKIEAGDGGILIPMSEEKPIEVKSAFNKLITQIKEREFQIKLDEVREDLFSQVANEYITQLNREIKEVRGEMKRYGLLGD